MNANIGSIGNFVNMLTPAICGFLLDLINAKYFIILDSITYLISFMILLKIVAVPVLRNPDFEHHYKNKKLIVFIPSILFIFYVGFGGVGPVLNLHINGQGYSMASLGIFVTIFFAGRLMGNLMIRLQYNLRKLLIIEEPLKGYFVGMSTFSGIIGIALSKTFETIFLFQFIAGFGLGIGTNSEIYYIQSFESNTRNFLISLRRSLFLTGKIIGLPLLLLVGGLQNERTWLALIIAGLLMVAPAFLLLP